MHIHEDADLLQLVTYLNEFPTVILGDFDPSFLELPDEILITVMRGHQKYFAVEKKRRGTGAALPGGHQPGEGLQGLVRAGHERVFRARFADARFFWESTKESAGRVSAEAAAVTYESRLGSYHDKVERMRAIARWLAEQWFNLGMVQARVADADRAGELAKCDLVTDMVKEFTELQGVVGGLYAALRANRNSSPMRFTTTTVPVGLDDPIPRNITGCAVALADKFDAIVGCFAVGIVPTGSSDPYSLRRAGLGIVKIILERKLPVSLSQAIAAAAKALHTTRRRSNVPRSRKRRSWSLSWTAPSLSCAKSRGYAYDEANAVFRAGSDDLVEVEKRLKALKAIRKTKNFEPLAVSFKRIRKILEKATLPQKLRSR